MKKKYEFAILFITLALTLSGCAASKVAFEKEVLDSKKQPESIWVSYYFWGLYSRENAISVSKLCGDSKLLNAGLKSDIKTFFPTWLTVGIYSPKVFEFQCQNDVRGEK